MRTFIITLTATTRMGPDVATVQVDLEDAYAAQLHAIELQGDKPGKINVRPLVELTAIEGRARWPHPLHIEASQAAREGHAAAGTSSYARARAQQNQDAAMQLQAQANMRDPLTRRCY